jgi:hypothetical protein
MVSEVSVHGPLALFLDPVVAQYIMVEYIAG